jgi:hypothetical protein
MSTVLFNKNGLTFIKKNNTEFTLEFSLENEKIILYKIIDFDLIKLIYDLNSDIYEKIYYNKINDTTVELVSIVKHLFKDLGLPQRFTHLSINKSIIENNILFKAKSIYDNSNFNEIPKNAEQIPIENIIIKCNNINDHKVHFEVTIHLKPNKINIPPYIEKMVAVLWGKIFNRLKQFIENIRV